MVLLVEFTETKCFPASAEMPPFLIKAEVLEKPFQLFDGLRRHEPPVRRVVEDPVRSRRKTGICTDDTFFDPEIRENLFLKRSHRRLFIFVPIEDGECKRYAFGVHKQPHLDNRVGPVLL